MAELILGGAVGAPFGCALQEFCEVIKKAVKEARMFKPHLESLQYKLETMDEWVAQIRDLNEVVGHEEEETKNFDKLMNEGKVLVEKCLRIGERNPAKSKYGSKLSKLEEEIQKFIDFFVPLLQVRNGLENMAVLKDILTTMNKILKVIVDCNTDSSPISFPLIINSSVTTPNAGLRNGGLSCAVPPPPNFTVGLDVHVKELKRKLLDEKVSLLVITAPEGRGKTTLVKKLCHNEQIKGAFKENIFFILASKTQKLQVIAHDLYDHKGYQVPKFQNDEDAMNRMGVLLKQIESPILLILDNVLSKSESLVTRFEFDISNYQILVTSRTAIKGDRFTYTLPPLNDEDADLLSRHSGLKIGSSSIIDECMEKIVAQDYSNHMGQPVRKNDSSLLEAPQFTNCGRENKLSILGCGISRYLHGFQRKKQKLQKFIYQNQGLILERLPQDQAGFFEIAKIFTSKELKKATKNFDDSRILGQGGFGTVYKGILPDSRVIAIKIPHLGCQIDQLINEIVVLSQVIHKNIARLLGCCLETKVPLLVYEFMPKGTLREHIHYKSNASPLQWEIRLRIALETAEALSYLQYASLTPIIHRDIKPTNILLNDDFTVKVSDFGISKLLPENQGEVDTMVQGTFGYLDPEYFRTRQLTKKSDVFSFGVVLLELLSGKEVFSSNRSNNERYLIVHFFSSLKEGRLFDIVENSIVEEGNKEQIKEVVELVKRCLRLNRDERPTMKEVAIELERIRKREKDPWANPQSNLAEAEDWLVEAFEPYKVSSGTSGYDCVEFSMATLSTQGLIDGR